MDKKFNKNQNNYHPFITKTLHFLVPVSILSFFFFLYNLHFSSSIFTVLDRKYMFLICNGILALLAKNLKLSSSDLNYIEIAEDGVQQITELPGVLKEDEAQENAASEDCIENVAVLEEKQEQDYRDSPVPEEKQIYLLQQDFSLESEDDDEDEFEESGGPEGTLVNDVRVSTEELNKKFEEFIRKMKEEIRIEARQQLMAM